MQNTDQAAEKRTVDRDVGELILNDPGTVAKAYPAGSRAKEKQKRKAALRRSQQNVKKRTATSASNDPGVGEVMSMAGKYLAEQGLLKKCRVEIERQEQWYVLKGAVESFYTKLKLISMVPKNSDGDQLIVDQLQIAPPS